MNTNFHIETQDTSPENITNILQAAGLKVNAVRTVTQNHDGIILTETLIKGIWNHETGQAQCKSTEQNPCNHREWDQLSENQQETFTRRLAEFLEYNRQEYLEASTLLEDAEDFTDVRLQPC